MRDCALLRRKVKATQGAYRVFAKPLVDADSVIVVLARAWEHSNLVPVFKVICANWTQSLRMGPIKVSNGFHRLFC